MGDWIKENKFEAALLGIVILAAIGAFVVGGKKGGEYQLQKDLYADNARKKATLESKNPYPNEPNVEAYENEVAEYRSVIDKLQEEFLAFRPKDFANVTPAAFTQQLNAAKQQLRDLYQAEGIEFPENEWQLGFSQYTDSPPRDDATAYLKYELEALEWLFTTLAESSPSALLNVYRAELPVEKGQPMEGGEEDSGGRRSRPRRIGTEETPPYYELPVELTFKAPEPAVREFLSELVSNDQYFFVIRSLRIQNEKRDSAPEKDDVEFDAAPAGGGGGNDAFDNAFENELIPADPAPGDPAPGEFPPLDGDLPPLDQPALPGLEPSGERILGQVLGSEELFVFLELELLLFKPAEAVAMPDIQ